MKKIIFEFNKLIRDNILKNMLGDSMQKPKYHVMEKEEYIKELKKKMLEEVQEFVNADNEEILEEMADVEEIISYMLRVLGKTREDLNILGDEKRKKFGGFEDQIFLEYNEINEDSDWVGFCRKNPEKYPERVNQR